MKLPERGIVFWPVGTGDGITIAVRSDIHLQVDLRHLEAAEKDDDPRTPIVDRLVELLPRKRGRPHLAAFVLTHPDEDHCQGFADLLDKVTIGELWFTPHIFDEYKKDLCDDAVAFRDEAERRVKKAIGASSVSSGDRVRLVGYDDIVKTGKYKGFPGSRLSVPGTVVTAVDDVDCADEFRAFIHAPFKDDKGGDRNDLSLAMQVTLLCGRKKLRAMLLGDLAYPTIKQIFKRSRAKDLRWNAFLAPHHCSKSVMYWRDEGEEKESLRQDMMDEIDDTQEGAFSYIVASSAPIPATNSKGDNPPHAKAREQYEKIAALLCTQEHGSEEKPEPIVFEVTEANVTYKSPGQDDSQDNGQNDGRDKGQGRPMKAGSVPAAVAHGRGAPSPPRQRVGFGRA
ncbi:hypothetical protein ACFL59_04900 [Planctomycetota bacterium]